VPDRVRPDQAGRVLDAIDTLSMWGAWASAACIASILGLIVAEVVSRNLFNISIYFAWEFSAYLMGAAFLMGAAYALRAGAIRVNPAWNVPKPVARFFDLFSTVCGVAIAIYLTWALAEMTYFSGCVNRVRPKSEILRWIVQFPLALGSLLFTLRRRRARSAAAASRATMPACASARTSGL
jgi:TRAP-type C4-dicarboxylate transport system permease small subunit